MSKYANVSQQEFDATQRIIVDVAADLGAVNAALGLDVNDDGVQLILSAIEQLKARAASAQKPFMFAIMGPDGAAHIEESCVSSDSSQLVHEVNGLNDSPDAGYSIVPVFLSACVSADLDEAKNAARYRHLRSKMCFSSSRDVLPTMAISSPIPAPNHDVHKDWVGGRFEASVDAAVDADMARTEADDE